MKVKIHRHEIMYSHNQPLRRRNEFRDTLEPMSCSERLVQIAEIWQGSQCRAPGLIMYMIEF
jgi:hypothetical protein